MRGTCRAASMNQSMNHLKGIRMSGTEIPDVTVVPVPQRTRKPAAALLRDASRHIGINPVGTQPVSVRMADDSGATRKLNAAPSQVFYLEQHLFQNNHIQPRLDNRK
jgi:hypothetical protein